MENYKAFYEFVKGVLDGDTPGETTVDKIDKIASAIKLMEIITKAPQ